MEASSIQRRGRVNDQRVSEQQRRGDLSLAFKGLEDYHIMMLLPLLMMIMMTMTTMVKPGYEINTLNMQNAS